VTGSGGMSIGVVGNGMRSMLRTCHLDLWSKVLMLDLVAGSSTQSVLVVVARLLKIDGIMFNLPQRGNEECCCLQIVVEEVNRVLRQVQFLTVTFGNGKTPKIEVHSKLSQRRAFG